MTSLKKRIMIIFGSVWGVCLVLLIVYYIFMVGPKAGELKRLKKELAVVTSSEMHLKTKKDIENSQTKCQKLREQVMSFVIGHDRWINMMPYVSDIAQKISVSTFSSKDITGEKIEEVSDCKNIGVKAISVSFNSSFLQFARFINELEGGNPVVFVREFTIQRSVENSSRHSVKMDLEFLVGMKDSTLFEKLQLACLDK